MTTNKLSDRANGDTFFTIEELEYLKVMVCYFETNQGTEMTMNFDNIFRAINKEIIYIEGTI